MKEGGGGGEGRKPFLSFLPHPLPAYSRHFFRGLCSERARKRLLHRLYVNLSFIQQAGQLPLSDKSFFQTCIFRSIIKARN